MEKEYPWYDVVDGGKGLVQGDLISECPIVIPPSGISGETKEIRADAKNYDVIVMSQSCDLAQKKIDIVLVCPYYPLGEIATLQSSGDRERLRKGYLFGYHLLKQCELQEFKTDHLVVDFHNVYGVDLGLLITLARERGRRLRLLPPYREHLSQAFARFFMRVGLPVEIAAFK